MNFPDTDKIISVGTKIADEVEVYLIESEEISLEQRESNISSAENDVSQKLLVRVVKDKKIGVSSSSDFSKWELCLDAALASAKLSKEVFGWKGFAEKTQLEKANDPFDEKIQLSPELAYEFIERMNAGAEKYSEARPVTAAVSLSTATSLLANSNGVSLYRKASEISLGMDAICDNSTGYEYDTSWTLSKVNPEKVGEQTAFWAVASRNGVTVESKKYDVVFSENAVASLVYPMLKGAINGKNVLYGKSVFADKIGDRVCSPEISFSDIPNDPEGNSHRTFDYEGSKAQDIEIVKDGVLNTFLYDLKTAAQAGTNTTGSAQKDSDGSTYISVHNLRMKAPVENVLSKPCLFVKEVIGAHTANSLTGEFSVEVANAFLAEGGEFKTPVKKAMLSGNVFEILKNGFTVSPETITYGSSIAPKMRVSNMQVI